MTTATMKADPVVNNALLAYYAQPGPMTDARELGYLLEGLPTAIGDLCQVVQQNMLHIFWAERYGRTPSEDEQATVKVRSLHQKLVRMRQVDDRPLSEPRPLAQRQIGNCRDFTLLLTAMLRIRRAGPGPLWLCPLLSARPLRGPLGL